MPASKPAAHVLSPARPQITKQLRKARVLDEEDKRERAVRAAAASLTEGAAEGEQGGAAGKMEVLRTVRGLTAGDDTQCPRTAHGCVGVNLESCGLTHHTPTAPLCTSIQIEKLARAIAMDAADGAAAAERSARSADLPSAQAAVASLEAALEKSDEARTYFRVCGGLASLLARAKALAAELSAPAGMAGCALPSRAGKDKKPKAAAAGEVGGAASIAAALRALRAAAVNEPNAGEILAAGAVAGAAVPALCSKAVEAAAAAAWLLHSLTELPEHRKIVVRELSASAAALEGLLAASRPPPATGAAPGQAQLAAHALGLLVNCALEPQARKCLAASPTAPADAAAAAAALLGSAPGLPPQLKALLRERAASLVTNLCGDAALRAALAGSATLVTALVAALQAPAQGAQRRDELEAAAAAAAALANLTLDPAAAASAASAGAAQRLAALLPEGAEAARALCAAAATTSGGGSCGDGEMPLLLSQRAALASARVVRAPGAAELFLAAGGVQRLLAFLAAATEDGHRAGMLSEAADACARALAVCAGAAPEPCWAGAKAGGGIGPLLGALTECFVSAPMPAVFVAIVPTQRTVLLGNR